MASNDFKVGNKKNLTLMSGWLKRLAILW